MVNQFDPSGRGCNQRNGVALSKAKTSPNTPDCQTGDSCETAHDLCCHKPLFNGKIEQPWLPCHLCKHAVHIMKCIVTAGPTYEPLDKVRRLTNLSTGRLGSELVNHLADCGHEVTLLIGQQATWRGDR